MCIGSYEASHCDASSCRAHGPRPAPRNKARAERKLLGHRSRNGYTEPRICSASFRSLRLIVAGISFHISMLMRLHFHGPFSVCSETDDVLANCPLRSGTGIYLWAVKQLTGVYRTSYLGETSESFYGRTKEYVVQTLGGNYRVRWVSASL